MEQQPTSLFAGSKPRSGLGWRDATVASDEKLRWALLLRRELYGADDLQSVVRESRHRCGGRADGVKAADYAAFLKPLFRLCNIRGALVMMPNKVTTVGLLDAVSVAVEAEQA